MAAALTQHGHSTGEETDLAEVVVLRLRSTESCRLIDELVGSGKRVIALLEPYDQESVGHTLYHRAAPVDFDAEPHQVVAAIDAALAGRMIVPFAFAERLATPGPHYDDPTPTLTPEEANWLRDLASGSTVTKIADEYGYSERAMFRRLHDLYVRLGVSGRAQALVTAERLGLLDD